MSNFARIKAAPTKRAFRLDDGGGRQLSDIESSDEPDGLLMWKGRVRVPTKEAFQIDDGQFSAAESRDELGGPLTGTG